MKRSLIILILLISQAWATVEDSRPGPDLTSTQGYPVVGTSVGNVGNVGCYASYVNPFGNLIVSVKLTGPRSESDRHYVTPGKALEYAVTVENKGYSEVEADIVIDPDLCRDEWFDWTEKTVTISPNGIDTQTIFVNPDTGAVPGDYRFQVFASAENRTSGSASGWFKVQDYDYISETSVSGTGQFQMDKDVRSANSGIKSQKDVYFSGSVDSLVKNEYMVEGAKGRTPNFQECDLVDNYAALDPGDMLMGTEIVKSSLVFGGIGAKFEESYNLETMEFKEQEIDIHHTGSMKKRANFQTIDNFTGYLMIDAKQSVPGQRNIREFEEFMGSFEVQRKITFKEMPRLTWPCDMSCGWPR